MKPIIKIILIIIILFLVGFGIFYYLDNKQNNITELANKQINEYEGKNLSSIEDFQENSIKGPQYINKEDYRLEISGLVNNVQNLSYDQVINNYNSYKKLVTLNCVEGWSVDILWQGVLVKDLLNEAGIKDSANTVIFYAEDGYSTSFPIKYILDNDILMAYKINDVELSPERGFPFQLVAEDKWGYKWIKWITKIELSDDSSFEGYWESRGYSNDGSLDKEFFDNKN